MWSDIFWLSPRNNCGVSCMFVGTSASISLPIISVISGGISIIQVTSQHPIPALWTHEMTDDSLDAATVTVCRYWQRQTVLEVRSFQAIWGGFLTLIWQFWDTFLKPVKSWQGGFKELPLSLTRVRISQINTLCYATRKQMTWYLVLWN